MPRPVPRRGPHRATLDDVARAAGVSRATASRVMAGYGPASPTARARVRAAAAEIGYTPDVAARALASGVGFRIVVAVAGPDPTVLDDWYVDRLVGSAAAVCARHGVGVALQWLPLQAPGALGRLAEDRGVRGVLVANPTEQVLDAIPVALAGRIASIGIGRRGVPSFDVDNGGATTAMVHHLYTTGRRRIAMVSGPTWLPCTWRSVEAYRSAMRAAGLPIRIVPGDFTAAGGAAAAASVLRRWPDSDAVLASSDTMALGVIAALRERAVDVPGDVAVTGFDDIPFAGMSMPALTTMSHPVDRIAAGAAAAVIEGSRVRSATLYGSQLILRNSA